MNPPRMDGVRYVVSCQNPGNTDDLSEELAVLARRDDMTVRVYDDVCSGRNRNHALDLATAPLVLVSDDDLRYTADGLRAVIEAFDRNPDIDFATFRSDRPEPHRYPPHEWNLKKKYPHFDPVTFEIAFRREPVVSRGIRFSDIAGVNGPYIANGEEDLLMNRLRRSDLNGRFFPETIVTHPGPTTSTRLARDSRVLRGRGAVFSRLFPLPEALARLALAAWRIGGNVPRHYIYMLQGVAYALKHRKEL